MTGGVACMVVHKSRFAMALTREVLSSCFIALYNKLKYMVKCFPEATTDGSANVA